MHNGCWIGSNPVSELVEQLRAIGEEEMYQAPATTKATIDKAAAELERLYARIAELEGVLRGIAGAIRIGAESDVIAWASLAKAMQHEAFSALTNSGVPDDEG
jgi:hypothetical protein